MLYVNDELIKKGTPYWDRYNEFLQSKLPKMSDPVIFRTGRPLRFNKSGLPERNPEEWIPLQHTTYGQEGDEYWAYCDRPPRKKQDGKMIYSPRGKIMRNGWKFDRIKDAELIFFFTEISPFVVKGRIVLEDKRRDARKVIDKEAGELDVKFMILSEHSPISPDQTGNEDTLRMVASGWGIANVEDLSIEEVKVELLSKVQTSNAQYNVTGRGFKEFLNEIDSRGKLTLRANVQRAVDKGIILYDDPNFTWRFASNNQPLMVVPVNAAADAQKALYNFLYTNEKLAGVLEYALTGDTKKSDVQITEPVSQPAEEPVPEVPSINVDEIPYTELKKLAKKLEINSFGVKKDELIEIIKEKVS